MTEIWQIIGQHDILYVVTGRDQPAHVRYTHMESFIFYH